jgi:hypothetical protein
MARYQEVPNSGRCCFGPPARRSLTGVVVGCSTKRGREVGSRVLPIGQSAGSLVL